MKTTTYFNPVSITLFVVLSAFCSALFYLQIINIQLMAGGIILSILIASSIHIADQWEKAVVLRMGKFTGLKGPGFFLIIPIIDRIDNYLDQRVRGHQYKS
jgi:regulator of protease activity HflC (stomatin/prohibitin superfamily)